MEHPPRAHEAIIVAFLGMLGLASAMGVGRFAFTPLLPLMQASQQLSLAQGAALASANYLGYLVGALGCLRAGARVGQLTKPGLAGVALATLAMAFTESFAVWAGWRFIAGATSAMVLIGVSNSALAALTRLQRTGLAGGVFAGVGAGIALAGIVSWWAATNGVAPQLVWGALGVFALTVAMLAWRYGEQRRDAPPTPAGMEGPQPLSARAWRLVACYGAFGFGYIIPATFLPVMAQQVMGDPELFGLAWPIFGLAAAASTLVASRFIARSTPRSVWRYSQLVMAAGVLAPVLNPHPSSIVLAALCVGGTFMVITMAGLQEARRLGAAMAPRAIAAMTAAFAGGQLLGPLVVRSLLASSASMTLASAAAACLLLASSFALRDRTRSTALACSSRNERT